MPFLKKRPFVKASVPEFLRDDEEVFHCAATNEIFRDYEEFCERIILCNSMVWTCCMTGKINLTYAEALESEENAKKSLKDFPSELRVPIIYLATLTQRTSFADMAEDVFMYARDRYFIGETVDACFSGNTWNEYQVQRVIPPTEEEIKNAPKNGNVTDRSNPPASLYKYALLQLNADDEDLSETMILEFNQVRRKKALYSREKNKLFLKQYAEQNIGIWTIKESVLKEFGIKTVKFTDIFDGPSPVFVQSKRIKTMVNGKKQKQETLAKFLSQNAAFDSKNKENLLEEMKKREERCKLMKQQKAEEKLAEKQRKKEENNKITNYIRDWYKPKEDLELEDQKKLPEFTPVISKVPDEYYGDVLMIVEFVRTFSKLLSTKKYFPSGLSLELMERALTEKEVAGPLMDVIQMLLIALFNVQEAEAAQYKTQIENLSEKKEEKVSEHMSLTEATYLATIASKFCNTYLGMPLAHLPLYTLTITEILRLHLLSSGARINDTGARWRYQERGGYTSEDDPGLYFRLQEPHIIKALALRSVVELPMQDKIKVLSCLINQLLTYADVRDDVEDRLEVARQAKLDLRAAQAAERKREAEFLAEKVKIKREGKANQIEDVEKELEKLNERSERKQCASQKKIQELMKKSVSYNQVVLGYDRAFRRYLKLESVPGIFISCDENNAGVCLEEPVCQKPELTNMERSEIVKYIKKEFFKQKDIGNEKINGAITEESGTYKELMVCSANPTTCPVHSTNTTNKWSFLHKEEQLGELLNSLNKRGIRESELEQAIQNYGEEMISKYIAKTPFAYLNPSLQVKDEEETVINAKPKKSKYEDANLGYPSEMGPEEVYHSAVMDVILDMEDKIFSGHLGSLKIKDRDAWRNCLTKRNYDEFLLLHSNLEKGKHVLIKREDEENDLSRSNSPVPIKICKDPGLLLGATLNGISNGSDVKNNKIVLDNSDDLKKAIKCWSIALNQIAQGVEPQYLKIPLGNANAKKDKRKYKCDVLPMWEQSLLASTSFSQIFLHYGTLDSCIKWSQSALKARCQICRRLRDSENMLLCDSCNNGHHLYCLKPKLKSVPPGKWYCDKCKRELGIEEEEPQPIPVVKKKRKLFSSEDEDDYNIKEEETVADDSNGDTSEESEYTQGEEEDMEEDENMVDEDAINGNIKIEICQMCGSGGELLNCKRCDDQYHIECVEPPLKRYPRGSWFCNTCKEKEQRRSKRDKRHVNGMKSQRTGRCCATRALHKIQDFTKSLQQVSESDDSDDEYLGSRRSRHEDFPLHNAALHGLLSDVMKHDDAWPFIRPVQKTEVPDYYDVISKPMDFGTIKYKLNMGNYKEDAELMADVALVFENCNTYNNSEALVYKCGQSLLQFFRTKCHALGLKLPEELEDDDEEELNDKEPKAKKKRTE